MKERLAEWMFVLARATVYPLTESMEWPEFKRQLERVDYPYSVGRYFAMMVISAFMVALLATIITVAGFATGILFVPEFAIFPIIAIVGTVIAYIVWPTVALSMKRRRMAANLPLAILTMSTVSDSGAPPHYMFDAIAQNPDYPSLGKECAKLKRFMNMMGLSFSEAITKTAEITPSFDFKRFLKELNTTLRSGGDMRSFMTKRADDAYFDYTVRLEQAGKNAETMGDIYSILMIAAPIFLFFTIMLLGIFAGGGQVFGFELDFLMVMGIFVVIPAINTGFLLFMEITAAE